LTPAQFRSFERVAPSGAPHRVNILVGTPYAISGEWRWYDQAEGLIQVEHRDDGTFSVLPVESIVSISVKQRSQQGGR
jgi:hypothetical protein